jgi:Tfp pilus assembly protein PilO
VEAAKHGAASSLRAATLQGEPEPWVGELEELRRRLAEVEERLDFAERLLARDREADRLGPPR